MNLLLIGGGHAMLPALCDAAQWTANGVRVTLLDGNRFLYYSGMVPEYLGGVYTQDEVRIDLKHLCKQANVRFIESAAEHLDPERRVVTTTDGQALSYDVAALDIGARNPALLPQAIRTKPLHHVEALEEQIQSALTTPHSPLHLVIAGGGAAGVEVALNVTSRFQAHGQSEALSLTIVEGADRLLPDFPTGMSTYATERLRERGANIQCAAFVESIQNGTAALSNERRISSDVVLWATGSVGPALFDDAGLICDAKGFVRVTDTLQCMGYPRLFAAGDCATVAGHEALRKVGVHAVKQGPVLQTNLNRTLSAIRAGQPSHAWSLDTFEPYLAAPLILSTGTADGLWTAGPVWFRGRPVLRLKHFVDRRWIRRYNPHWQDAGPRQWLDAHAAATAVR